MSFSAAKKKLELTYNFSGDKETIVSGDGFRLKQIMVNLLGNAIKFTKTGSVKVNADVAVKDGKTWLNVEVADTGTGISAEQQNNLFSKYYQTSSAIGKAGTGLGLYICRQLVQLQNGHISVKSVQGQGSTFSFSIPYQELTSGVRTVSIQSVDKPLSLINGLKILAVDSNELNLMFMKVMTSQWNIRFFEASTGAGALAIIEKESVDIIITDIKLPDMDAYTLISACLLYTSPSPRDS